jgi:hypothetical protein
MTKMELKTIKVMMGILRSLERSSRGSPWGGVAGAVDMVLILYGNSVLLRSSFHDPDHPKRSNLGVSSVPHEKGFMQVNMHKFKLGWTGIIADYTTQKGPWTPLLCYQLKVSRCVSVCGLVQGGPAARSLEFPQTTRYPCEDVCLATCKITTRRSGNWPCHRKVVCKLSQLSKRSGSINEVRLVFPLRQLRFWDKRHRVNKGLTKPNPAPCPHQTIGSSAICLCVCYVW